MPMIAERYNVSSDPANVGVMGSALGGATAIHFAYYRPDLSGWSADYRALWINNQYLIDMIEADSTYSVKYALQWGNFEGDDVIKPHERLVRVLREKGYDVDSEVNPEGHSWGHWRSYLDDLLHSLYPVETDGDKAEGVSDEG